MRNCHPPVGSLLLHSVVVLGLVAGTGCSAQLDQGLAGWKAPSPAPRASKNVSRLNSPAYTHWMSQGNFSQAAILNGFEDVLRATPKTAFVNFQAPPRNMPSMSRNPVVKPHPSTGNPLDAGWHAKIGWTLMLDGNYKGAEAAYRVALRHNTDFAEAFLGLGMALMMQGKKDGAIPAFETALKLKPDYPAALVHLGYAYTDGQTGRQDYQKARGLFKKASAHGDPFALLALLDLRVRQRSAA